MSRIICRFILESDFFYVIVQLCSSSCFAYFTGCWIKGFCLQKPWDDWIDWIFVICFLWFFSYVYLLGPNDHPDVHALGYEFDPLGPATFLDRV